MSSVLGKLSWSIRHRGVGGTLLSAAKSLGRRLNPPPHSALHPFDREHCTDTGGLIAGGDLASGHPSDRHIEGYAAVPPSRFRNIIARWQASEPPHAIGEYCFIDVGCGKGRALLLASELGFREAVGVELNPSLASIARSNVGRWIAAGKARGDLRVEEGDAIDLEWPPRPCVVFLFNPFDAMLTRQLADRLAAAFRDRPSDLEVIYYKAAQAGAFANDFEMIWCEATSIRPEDLAVDPVADLSDETRAYRLTGRAK